MRVSKPCALIVGGDEPTQLMLRYLLTREGGDVVAVDDVQVLEQAASPAAVTLVVVAGWAEPRVAPGGVCLGRRGRGGLAGSRG